MLNIALGFPSNRINYARERGTSNWQTNSRVAAGVFLIPPVLRFSIIRDEGYRCSAALYGTNGDRRGRRGGGGVETDEVKKQKGRRARLIGRWKKRKAVKKKRKERMDRKMR